MPSGGTTIATLTAECKSSFQSGDVDVTVLTATQLLLPGFIDCHIHAPQYAYVGLGTDCPLMGPEGWLETHAFPAERRLTSDPSRAKAVFGACVSRTLGHGTTTALYFATQDTATTGLLADCCSEAGQRAFVGRVAMDRHCPENYADKTAEDGVKASEASCRSLRPTDEGRSPSSSSSSSSRALVQPSLTPRFVPTSSAKLLEGIGHLAALWPEVVVQSHVSESLDEVEFTKFAEADESARDVAILDRYGLLRAPSVLAHGVHLTRDELSILAERGCSVAHCPLSNAYFANGHLDILTVLELGCRVCLGTDVAGGYSPSMLSAIRQAVVTSRDFKLSSATEALSWRGALWLATVGGAESLGLGKVVGRLEAGFDFDALLVDADGRGNRAQAPYEARELTGQPEDGPVLPPMALLERFINLGDDRNVRSVYVQGKLVLRDGGSPT